MKLICYLSNGYPSFAASQEMAARYVDAGCDAIEIDIPAREPYLEGQNIVSRMKTALDSCGDLFPYLEAAADIRQRYPNVLVLVLVYEDSIIEIGEERFIAYCRNMCLLDLIVVGRGKAGIRERLMAAGLQVSCYVQFDLPEEELRAALASNGFVYLQAKPITGNVNPAWPSLKAAIDRLREIGISRPIYCGVGIHEPADVNMVHDAGGDGVFVGSAILKHDHDPEALMAAIRRFKAMIM